MNELIIETIVNNLLDIVISVIAIIVSVYLIPLIKNNLVPWLKEKRIYNLTKKFVEAVEKLAETGVIEKKDKKDTVIELLEDNGITITSTVDAFIESAVEQLDLIIKTVIEELNK